MIKKVFNFIMALITVRLAKYAGYTPDEVLKMYEDAEAGKKIKI